MDRLIYTALSGLTARQRGQAVTANNLANAETTGFKREIIAAEGRWLRGDPVLGAGSIARAQAGAPSLATPASHGKLLPTGRPLDIAAAGEAWFAIAGPVVNGIPTEAYTRRGDLHISSTGRLENGEGRPMLDSTGQPIQVPANGTLEIAADGTLSMLTDGISAPLTRLKLVAGGSRETGFDKGPDGQFTSRDALPADPAARLVTGTLETANVQASAALVELVEQSRAFDASARLLRTAREIDEAGSRLIRMES